MNIPHPNDPQAMRRYSRSFSYDNSGNISEMAHTATGANWTRDYSYTSGKNRLASTVIGGTTVNYTHDNNGNIESLPNTGAVTWDSEDRIKEVDLGGGGTAYYTYNAEGQRVRKVIHNNSDIKIKETIYLDGYELYHEFASGSIDFERETVHIMDDQTMIAMAETLTIENGNPVATPVTRLRYQISDHLGSGSIELSETGAIISFEEYYPYGGTSFHSTSSSSQVSAKRYRYNGKEKDEETNLYYYGARYYISWLGRWMSCDPGGEIDGLNLYSYVNNNPVIYTDPEGNEGNLWDRFMEGVDTVKSWVHEKSQGLGQTIADTGEKIIEGAGIESETAKDAIRTAANVTGAVVGAAVETSTNLTALAGINIAKGLDYAGKQLGKGAAQIAQGEVGAGLKSIADVTGLVSAGEGIGTGVGMIGEGNVLEGAQKVSEGIAIGAGNVAMGLAAAKAIRYSGAPVTEPPATKALHKNTNAYKGPQAVYKIEVDGQLHKYGKADMTSLNKMGDPTRLATQVSKLQRKLPEAQVRGSLVESHANISTKQIKAIETSYIKNHYKKTGNIPPGNPAHKYLLKQK